MYILPKNQLRITKTWFVEMKTWFIEKINKFDKYLAKLTKKKRVQINKIRNKRGDITIGISEIKWIYYTKETIMNSYTSTNWTS